MRLPLVCLLFIVTVAAQAGTTVIHVETEGQGTIDKATGETNLNGAMVWNGTEWIVNSTWAHKFFVDTRTGERLKSFTTMVLQGNQPATTTYGNYTIQRTLYSYQKNVTGGLYSFNAVQYRVHDDTTGKEVVLRSRGTGTGTANPYFDIYIDDEMTSGSNQVTALRGDPAWFTYAGTMDQALLQTSPTINKTGDLPGCTIKCQPSTANGDYYLDIANGADLGPAGFGKSFQFHTAALTLADPALALGSAFAVDFSYKWMDNAGNLQELRFLPYAEGRKSTTPGFRNLGSMAQLASGNYWKTTITLVNHGIAAARARLNFFDNDGVPLSLPISYPSLPPAAPVWLTSVERTLAPGASFSFFTTGPDNEPPLVGWAQMLTDGDISGFAIFRQKVNREQEAVVPLETHNTDSYVLWFNNSGNFASGVAIANGANQPANVGVIIRDEAGAILDDTQTIQLAALGHTSFVLAQQFPQTSQRIGSLEFRTPQGGQISVLGLRFNGISFTTIPVLDRPLQTATAPLTSPAIPAGSAAQLASGTYWATTITLVNKGVSSARAKLEFFDNQGNPLVLPVSFPATPGVPAEMISTLERTLAPGASLSLSSTGLETVGWARLSTDGDVGGFAIFRQDVDGAQEALVPMEIGDPDAWLLWFDNTGTFASGVAVVNNALTPASVQVIVRDEAGAQIQSQTLDLAGMGHTSFAISSVIGNTGGKVGSVEFRTPPGGAITVLGLRFNGVSFTTIPVMPMAVP